MGRVFSDEFDDEFPVAEYNNAYVGRNVLRGLVSGIDDFIHAQRSRRSSRELGPVLLGSAAWIDDNDLIEKLKELSGACIVVTKQGRKPWDIEKLEHLGRVNAETPGLPIKAFPGLDGLAPRIGDQPVVVGPYDRVDDVEIPTIRTLGFRPRAGSKFVPLLHAKLALLGHFWWHDEDALGHVADIIGFTPRRLWVSSANFTRASRNSLGVGYWTEEPALLKGMERFLVKLIASSEGLDPDDDVRPQLLPVEFDDVAMAEGAADMDWDEADEDY
jgi:hypothetical protein